MFPHNVEKLLCGWSLGSDHLSPLLRPVKAGVCNALLLNACFGSAHLCRQHEKSPISYRGRSRTGVVCPLTGWIVCSRGLSRGRNGRCTSSTCYFGLAIPFSLFSKQETHNRGVPLRFKRRRTRWPFFLHSEHVRAFSSGHGAGLIGKGVVGKTVAVINHNLSQRPLQITA